MKERIFSVCVFSSLYHQSSHSETEKFIIFHAFDCNSRNTEQNIRLNSTKPTEGSARILHFNFGECNS